MYPTFECKDVSASNCNVLCYCAIEQCAYYANRNILYIHTSCSTTGKPTHLFRTTVSAQAWTLYKAP